MHDFFLFNMIELINDITYYQCIVNEWVDRTDYELVDACMNVWMKEWIDRMKEWIDRMKEWIDRMKEWIDRMNDKLLDELIVDW